MGRSGAWTAMLAVAVAMVGVVAAVEQCSPPPQPAQAPGADCYSIVLTMADCLQFVQNGSTQVKPSAGCCDGMKTVLKQGPQCLCVVLRDSGSLGIVVNTTKALELPLACGVSAPPISQCSGGSPVAPPTPSSQPPQPSPPATPSPASPPPQAAPSPATPPPQAAPSPATPPPQAAPLLPPQSAPSPSSPPQAPLQPPATRPPAPAAAPSGGGSLPAPASPPSSDDNNNSGAKHVSVPLLLSGALVIAIMNFHC